MVSYPEELTILLLVQVGDTITIDKDRKWKDFEVNILRKSGNNETFILVAIDAQKGSSRKGFWDTFKDNPKHLFRTKDGKRYQQGAKNNPNIATFFEDIAKTIQSMRNTFTGENDSNRIIIFGPGETKLRFYNLLVKKNQFEKDKVSDRWSGRCW